MKTSTITRIIRNPLRAVRPLAARGLLNFLPDKMYLKFMYRGEMGKKLNIENPSSFNEKIQWLKLYDHDPVYVQWVDKLAAKQMVEDTIGESYVVPLISSWDDADDIDFSLLPEVCVLKCNHDQGSTVIYRRGKSDEGSIREHFKKRLKKNAYSATREWPYKSIQPKILCEKFMADQIVDYKLFCFNGEPRIINIGQKSEQDKKTRITFLDLEWNQLPFQRNDFDRIDSLPSKPRCYEEMLRLAKQLALRRQFVRIDFFVVDERLYFSEFTLYPTSGLIKFSPPEADYEVGSWLNLEVKR